MTVIALTFAELATLFPVAGGTVRFTQFSHGTLTSFTMAWISWLAAVIVAPIETMAMLQYAANYFPALAHSVHHTINLTPIGILVAAGLMLIMCCLNILGVKFFAKTNNVIVSWKLLIPVVTAIALFSHHFNFHHFTEFGGFMPYGIKGMLKALPAAGVIFSFIGYSPAIQLAAEAKNPHRAIPFAILIAIGFCMLLYMSIQTAFIGAVSTTSLLKGWMNMHFAGEAGPIAGIITGLGLFWFAKLLYLDAIISPVGTAYIYTASTARVNYAMSENGYMPHIMQKLNPHGSPMIAVMTNFCVGMIFFLPFPGWQTMVSFLVSCFVIAYAVGPIACLSLRYKMPNARRSFRLPAAKCICLLAFYICNLIIYWTTWQTVWRMLVTISMGYIFLIIYRLIVKENKFKLDFLKAVWLFPYFIGLGTISYFGSFGGHNVIKFGWDFLVLAVFSFIIFVWAVRASQPHSLIKE